MDKQASSSSSNTQQSHPQRGMLYYLQVILGISMVIATMFTAFNPENLLPESLVQKVSQAFTSPNPEATSQDTWPTPTSRPQQHIGIVSGHWGNDSGAVCPDGVKEVDVNQDVATRVKENLNSLGYEVDLLKEFDPRLTEYQAMVLVSIHADSCAYINDEATGFKVAAAMSTVYPEKAARLTNCLRARYAEDTGLPFHPGSVTNDMSSYHAFTEINSDTTAAIIETGFLNRDHQFLTQHPDIVARGITDGILCFVRNEDINAKNTPTP